MKKDPLETLLKHYVDDFVAQNKSARTIADGLRVIGIGFWPIVDHLTLRTLHVDERAKEFLKFKYVYDSKLGILEYNNWFAKVYRKPGYPPLFIDQAYEGSKGKGSLIPDWVKAFGDKTLHHVAIRVEEIEQAVFYLEKQGVKFAGEIVGEKGSDLRQIFTDPEMKKGKAFSVVELTERHRGYTGFSPPQANRLMESTRVSY
ncbi:MAG: hypothetical protein HY447_00755 [Candidatus Omnitrophica bacterium]|nr:hypothetical protein [Candidatus Omnitrophota bacterium]